MISHIFVFRRYEVFLIQFKLFFWISLTFPYYKKLMASAYNQAFGREIEHIIPDITDYVSNFLALPYYK